MMDKKTFLFVGLAVALVIAAMAPFVASSNPDGSKVPFSASLVLRRSRARHSMKRWQDRPKRKVTENHWQRTSRLARHSLTTALEGWPIRGGRCRDHRHLLVLA